MEVVATAKWVRVTARKARLVANSIKGMPVNEALTVLRFTPRHVSGDVAKVIKSAAANAEHNYNLDPSSLKVSRVVVEDAVIIKRMRAKARGRMGSIFKRTSHLVAYVSDDHKLAQPRRGTAAAPAAPDSKGGTASRAGAKKATAGKAGVPRPRVKQAGQEATKSGGKTKTAVAADKKSVAGTAAGSAGAGAQTPTKETTKATMAGTAAEKEAE